MGWLAEAHDVLSELLSEPLSFLPRVNLVNINVVPGTHALSFVIMLESPNFYLIYKYNFLPLPQGHHRAALPLVQVPPPFRKTLP